MVSSSFGSCNLIFSWETSQKSPLHGPKKFNTSMSSYVLDCFRPGIRFAGLHQGEAGFLFPGSLHLLLGHVSGKSIRGSPCHLTKNGRKHPKAKLGQAKTHLRRSKTHFSPFWAQIGIHHCCFQQIPIKKWGVKLEHMNITHFKNRRIQLCPSPPGPYVGGIPWALDMC